MSFGQNQFEQDEEISDINMTPMVDVMLVLLIDKTEGKIKLGEINY